MNSSTVDQVIAIDVGGTSIKGAIVENSTIVLSERWPTEREHGGGHSAERVIALARHLAEENPQAKALGIVVPGLVDVSKGVAVYSENIGWRDIAFRQLIHEATGLPVGFGHDVRAGGLAEKKYGAGIGIHDLLFISLGTGISGAVFVGDQLMEDSFSGEVGHIEIGSGESCACGGANCLETVATGASMARRYKNLTGLHVAGSAEVLELAKTGDQIALTIWDDALEGLAKIITIYTSILAPELIILGGGISKSGEDLLQPLREKISKVSLWQRKPRLTTSYFGDNAAVIGAAILAQQELA